jgi:hypothetical protein
MATVPKTSEQAQQKPSICVSVQINFDHMTWGELKHFITLADREHVDDSEPVCLAWDESDYDDSYAAPIGLKFSTLDSGL